jgi:hypothetical protein
MKFMKYLFVLAIAFCAISSAAHAQATIQFLGGGVLYVELGQAAVNVNGGTGTACLWTQSPTGHILAQDNRTIPSTTEQGAIWIVWTPGPGTCAAPSGAFNIFAYMSLESVIAQRCYFEVDSSGTPGCVENITIAAGTAGANLLSTPDTPGGIPAAVIAALNGQHWFVAGTDVRPEDAKFASLRMFTSCGTVFFRQPFDQGLRQTTGLGYQTATTGVGMPVQSAFSVSTYHVLDFNISGNDPITTTANVPAFTVSTIGAQPIVVAVAPAGGTGIGAATDISGFNLTLFMQGVLGRNTDLFGPTVTAPVTTLIREPLSGTYNIMEFSIPNSSQFHGSQDDNNCNGSGGVFANPMLLQSADGQTIAGGAAFRKRVIGTGEMITQIKAATTADQRIGYFSWSPGNASAFTAANGKYLTVNAVDPLQNAYSDGVFPGVDISHPLSNVTFKWVNQGEYPIWSAPRIVSKAIVIPPNPPVPPPAVTAIINAVQTLPNIQNDFIPLSNLKVWHSHYYLPAIGSSISANGNTINTANDLCNAPGALAEFGGDAGGANTVKQSNADFCTDFGNQNGLINKAN